jgi:L-alanine-DL-glutamate epimerase-like enolase superfamily enzyme
VIHVESVRAAQYHLPREAWWPVAIVDHTLAIDAIDLVTCEVETAEGVTGFGYTYSLSRGGGPIRAMLADEIAPVMVGAEVQSPEVVWRAIWKHLYRLGRGGAAAVAMGAADVALWDALAKAAGLPLYRYLGAFRERVPVYGSSIDLGFSQDALLATTGEWMERGFGAVKIKVGRSAGEDLERLAAVREQIGPDVRLMVDANNGWDLPEASRRIELMKHFDLTWLEEPLAADDLEGHARLQAISPIPIAAGETLFSTYEFARYMRADAIRFIQADVGRLGGITPWLQVAQIAEAHHLPMAPHFLHDIHVHLLCAIPNAHMLEYLPLLDALLERPLIVEDGLAVPPEEPGIGVRFDAAALRDYRIGAPS